MDILIEKTIDPYNETHCILVENGTRQPGGCLCYTFTGLCTMFNQYPENFKRLYLCHDAEKRLEDEKYNYDPERTF